MIEKVKLHRSNIVMAKYKLITPRNGKYTPELREAKLKMEHDFFPS